MKARFRKSQGLLLLAFVLHVMSCETKNLDKADLLSRDEAEQLAVAQLKNGYIVGVTQEIDLGRQVFKVFVQNESKARRVMLDILTGRIIEVKDATEEYQEALAKEESVLEPVSLSHRDAAEFSALQAAPGQVRKWRVMRDETGRMIFRFNIVPPEGGENRVTVDARSQAVLEIAPVENKS